MYQRILVAVDGSKTAQRALDEAIRLAAQCQAQLRLVYAVDEVSLVWKSDFADMTEIQRQYRDSGLKILEEALVTARRAGAQVETRLLEVDRRALHVADAIAAEAENWPADLIVIGTHGRRGVRRLLLGSVAEGVARLAARPVLLVRGG